MEVDVERAILGAASAVASLRAEEKLVDAEPMPPAYRKDVTEDVVGYRRWVESTEASWRAWEVRALRRLDEECGPLISILTPVYEPDLDLLERCVRSVIAQSYPRWELCLCDDASPSGAPTSALARFERLDPRIRVTTLRENGGISSATNGAAGLASGTFVGFMDQDDELDPRALALVAEAIVDHPSADLFYTDEDKLDPAGDRIQPYFKPDWSPDLLLSNMYIGHFTVVRRSLFDEVGGLRSEFDGSQDYDLALRVTERARAIVHVPYLAYRWRMGAGSTAADYSAKPGADTAARRALADAMSRRGEDATVESGLHEGTFRVRRRLRPGAKVSIIVPFRDGAGLLELCVRSLKETAADLDWELLLVDNRSWEPDTVALLRTLRSDDRVRVLPFDAPFNWSAINNLGAEHTDGDLLLFMNSDIEAIRTGWLGAMAEHALRQEVGVVGARLLYPDDRVQHAGVVLGLGGGVAWHPFCFLPPDRPGYFAQPKVIRNWSAVTGACMMVHRPVFETLGGFDEGLAVAFNDVDFCLRARAADLSVVYTPFAELYHHESASRGQAALEARETVQMFERWPQAIRRDPFFNDNLDRMRAEYAVSIASSEVTEWDWILRQAEIWLSEHGHR